MNKTDIKQIILEEIEATLEEMRMSPEMMAADSRPEDEDFSLEDEMEMARDFNDEQDDIFGKPSFVEEDGLEEMARTSNVFKLSQNADLKQVLQFMQRVNDVLKTYKSPGQKRPKKRFTPEEMKALAKAMLKPEGFTSKDVIAATSYNSPAQANKFLKALEMKGLITLTSQLKKAMKPTRDPNAPETRGRKRKDAEFDMSDDPMADLDALGLGGSIDLSDPLAENNNTMSELEKYIKKVIKEAKNPLAKKMKEIENQGRVAALETKLAAIAEMIEETEGRLTRIDEDNEFRDMMDKNAVKEVRKQLKELERAKAKLEKERAKMEGKGIKKKEVVDEDLPVAEDAVENAVDEVELEEDNFKLNESTLRMQKLAGLITESELKKKLSLKENKIFNRTFKQNPVNIPGVDPKVAAILDANIPDEVAGSFDDANMQFVAPFDSEELVIADGPDLLDAIGSPESGLTPKDLPTEYVEIPPASFEDIDYKGFRGNPYLLPTDGSLDDNTGRNLEARTFAKYVPGKGLMYRFITKEV